MYSLFARLYSLQTLFDYCYVLGCDDRLDHVFHLSKHKYKKSRKTLILRDLLLLFRHLSLTLSGETGIRTPGTSQYNGFQDRRNRPLCHLSKTPFQKYFPLKALQRYNFILNKQIVYQFFCYKIFKSYFCIRIINERNKS